MNTTDLLKVKIYYSIILVYSLQRSQILTERLILNALAVSLIAVFTVEISYAIRRYGWVEYGWKGVLDCHLLLH